MAEKRAAVDASWETPVKEEASSSDHELGSDFIEKPDWKGKDAVKKEVKDEPVKKIKVTKIPEGTTEETLMNYFENRRRNGGGPIETIEYHPATSSAIIEFQEADDVVRVLKKRPLLFLKKQISVEECVEKAEDDEEEPPCRTIEVRGFTETNVEDVLEMYFENSRRSGGGEVTSVKITDGVALITFADEDVAQRVASHGQHKVAGQPLEVKLYIPPVPRPTYEDRVLLAGLTSKVTRESLTNFLEAKLGLTPASFLYSEEEDKVIITFDDNINFQKLDEACKKRALEGSHLQPSKVHVSNCILVLNLKISTTEETIQLYFENEKRSWGGTVEKVEFKREEEYCLVFFEDHSICKRVLQQKHKIGGSELQVSMYYECLGRILEDDTGTCFKPPKPVKLEVPDVDKSIFSLKWRFSGRTHNNKDIPWLLDIVLNPDHDLIVTDGRNKELKKFSLEGQLKDKVAFKTRPDCLALTDGYLVTVTFPFETVLKVVDTKDKLSVVSTIPFKLNCAGIRSMKDGRLIICNRESRSVFLCSKDGKILQEIKNGNSGETPFRNPSYVGVADNRTIYISDYSTQEFFIILMKDDSKFIIKKCKLTDPRTSCVVDGMLLVAASNIRVFTLDGNEAGEVNLDGVQHARGLVFSEDKRLLAVTHKSNADEKISVYQVMKH